MCVSRTFDLTLTANNICDLFYCGWLRVEPENESSKGGCELFVVFVGNARTSVSSSR